jgi:hypothetical protein
MITVIPMPKENQDEIEAVSVLPKLLCAKRRPTTEDLWIFFLSKGIEGRQQCPVEGAKPAILSWRLPAD